MKTKLYKYKYLGTSGISVCQQSAQKAGDVIKIPIKNFKHELFKSCDGGDDYPENVMKLKGKGKGKNCLLIGRGSSSELLDYKKYKDYIKIAVNPRENVLKKSKPEYVVYLENNYSVFINRNLDLFNQTLIIGNELALNCEKVNFHYGRNELIEGASSGFYALQIALLMDFKSIELIGYDYNNDEYKKEIFDLWLKDFKSLDLKNVKQLNKKSKLIISDKK